jgi:hypothetical protein
MARRAQMYAAAAAVVTGLLTRPGPLIVVSLVIVGLLTIATGVLFARSDSPAKRLVSIINALRRPRK